MAQRTALQNLIDELKQFKKFPLVDQATIEAAIEFAELRLPMEKEQIKESYGVGRNDGCAYMTNDRTEFEGSEQYYNETYGTK